MVCVRSLKMNDTSSVGNKAASLVERHVALMKSELRNLAREPDEVSLRSSGRISDLPMKLADGRGD